MPKLDLRNCDCMELMDEFPDKYFELAIVDPPFGIFSNNKSNNFDWKKSGSGGTWASKYGKKASKWDIECPFEVPDGAFMAIELTENALENKAGVVQFPEEFME